MVDTEVVHDGEPRLSADPRLSELFEFMNVDAEQMGVLPVSVQQQKDDTRLLIAIRGEHETASFLMANLMTAINDMHGLAEQERASKDDDESSISA